MIASASEIVTLRRPDRRPYERRHAAGLALAAPVLPVTSGASSGREFDDVAAALRAAGGCAPTVDPSLGRLESEGLW